MATVGLIGTGLAYLNLKKAENEYNALVDQQDALIAALETMRSEKNYKEKDWVDPNPIDLMPGVGVTTILRVGNLVRSVFHAKASVVISNTSDKAYFIRNVAADCFVFDIPVVPYRLRDWWMIGMSYTELQTQSVAVNKMIQPGEVMEIGLPGGTSAIVTPKGENKLPELRQMVCDAAGKKLVTSIWYNFNIDGGEKADIRIDWSHDETSGIKHHVTMRKPGVLRYCGEAFYAN